jgi:hypothetical protein
MENIPQTSTAKDEIKHLLLVFAIIFGTLCVLLVCTTGGLYGGFRIIEENNKQAAVSTAVAQSTQVAGYMIFDDFHDNTNDWDSGSQSNDFWGGTLNIQDDMYIWNIDEFHKDGTFLSWRDYGKNIHVSDFDMSVDAKLDTPEADLCYGVVFRETDAGSYMFTVCDHQRFAVRYNKDGSEQDEHLQPWKFSSAIRRGDWNTLAIRARGDHFVLSINNQVVFEFTDARFPGGKVFLLLDSNEMIPGTILFDNFGLQPIW